jgi:hypothetical protein
LSLHSLPKNVLTNYWVFLTLSNVRCSKN